MRAVLAILALSILAGCSTTGQVAERGAPDVITREQIEASNGRTAYDVIQRVRPTFLRTRGTTSTRTGQETLPTIYLDGMPFGPLRSLHDLVSDRIEEIRYVNARDATTRWGTGHTAGVILVTTRR